jgi:epoxyqueuosine reductase
MKSPKLCRWNLLTRCAGEDSVLPFFVTRKGWCSVDRLRQAAYRAGLDGIAVTHARPLTYIESFLREAQAEGRYAQFAHEDIGLRLDPKNVFHAAKSVISGAVAYKTVEPGPAAPLTGRISRSAWGKDYHKVVREALERLVPFLQAEYGVKQWHIAVDDTPLIERALAGQSKLAAIGANCAAYVPPFGSWVFLGEIVVDVELPTFPETAPSLPCEECGERCVKACPTGALMAPGKIDAKRCLSFLTQKTGAIPPEFRKKLGNRLWGCDTCQEACPINQRAKRAPREEFSPIIGPHYPLLELLAMGKAQIAQAFGETSMAWRGKNVLQRNACLILGNQKAAAALPVLKDTADHHPSPTVREAAAWAVAEIEGA